MPTNDDFKNVLTKRAAFREGDTSDPQLIELQSPTAPKGPEADVKLDYKEDEELDLEF